MSVQGSHLLGGYIRYKPIGSPSSLTYEITVVQFADSRDGKAAHRDELFINFGDGTYEIAEGHLAKIPVAKNVWKNIYKIQHTYPGDGCYLIATPIFNDLKNVSGDASPFQHSELCISPGFGKVNNSSPQITDPFPFSAKTDSVYKFNPIFTEHDTDSLALSTLHLGKGYKWPSEIEPFKNSYELKNGELIWDKPNIPGRYLLSLRQEEYRTVSLFQGKKITNKIGYVVYWWMVDVEGPANTSDRNSTAFSVLMENENIKISSTETSEGEVMLFDMAGRTVSQARLVNGQCRLPTGHQHRGIYALTVSSNEGIYTKKLLLR